MSEYLSIPKGRMSLTAFPWMPPTTSFLNSSLRYRALVRESKIQILQIQCLASKTVCTVANIYQVTTLPITLSSTVPIIIFFHGSF